MKLYKAKCDQDKGVFKCPQIDPNTLDGFEMIRELFVDNSGFGQEGEPALTPDQFLKEVTEGFYYGITDVGQFQLFVGEFEKIA